MTTFDDRERAFETLFAHDQELAFKALVRRARATGLWVATLLGKHGAEAGAYVDAVVATQVLGGESAVLAKLGADLAAGGCSVSQNDLRERFGGDLAQASRDVRVA